MRLIKTFFRNVYPIKDLDRERDNSLNPLQNPGVRELHEKAAFAHWGEDQVIEHYLKEVAGGCYVDIGCYHPSLYSNTKILFNRGWSGINIDANPFMIEEFSRERPNDINLNIAIGLDQGMTTLMLFHNWASSNTVSSDFAEKIMEQQNIQVAKRINVPVFPLRSILDEYLGGRRISFMNIDIESVDLEALESNDWDKHRPTLLAIEDFEYEFSNPLKSRIFNFLAARDYVMVSRCVYTSFFLDRNQKI